MLETIILRIFENLPELFLYTSLLVVSLKFFNLNSAKDYIVLGSVLKIIVVLNRSILVHIYNSLVIDEIIGALVYPSRILLLFGLIACILNYKQIKVKQPVIVSFVLGFLSGGLFLPFWYLKMHKLIKINSIGIILLIFFIVFTLSYGVLNGSVINTELIVGYFFRILTYITAVILAFKARKNLLRNYPEIKQVDGFLTFLFGIFYLQYIINKHEEFFNKIDQ